MLWHWAPLSGECTLGQKAGLPLLQLESGSLGGQHNKQSVGLCVLPWDCLAWNGPPRSYWRWHNTSVWLATVAVATATWWVEGTTWAPLVLRLALHYRVFLSEEDLPRLSSTAQKTGITILFFKATPKQKNIKQWNCFCCSHSSVSEYILGDPILATT